MDRDMEITDESFEDSLERRLREELDQIRVTVPSLPVVPVRHHRYLVTAALAACLLGVLGAGSAFASGSPNPTVWAKSAAHSLGLPDPDFKAPSKSAPSKDDTESHSAPAPAPAPAPTKSTPRPSDDAESGSEADRTAGSPSPRPTPTGTPAPKESD
jgi:hypothetical protein